VRTSGHLRGGSPVVQVDEQPPAQFGNSLTKGSDNIKEEEVVTSATVSKKVQKNDKNMRTSTFNRDEVELKQNFWSTATVGDIGRDLRGG